MRSVLSGVVMIIVLAPPAHAQLTIAPVIVASASVPLFDAVVRPGAPVVIQSDAICVCWQQTLAEFPNHGWSSPSLQCRPTECVKRKTCLPSLAKPLRIVARSK